MAILPDDALKTAQHEVQRLLGRRLLRLQQFERQIKAIVAHHEISGPADNLEAVRAARRQDSNGKTLGTLVGSLLGLLLPAMSVLWTRRQTVLLSTAPGLTCIHIWNFRKRILYG